MSNEQEWRPAHAPELQHDFKANAQENVNQNQANEKANELSLAQQEYQRYFAEKTRSHLEQQQEQTRKPATKRELEFLLEQRERPKPVLNYDMVGTDQRAVEVGIQQRNQNRIHSLVERLAPMQNKARDDFNINADNYQHEKKQAEQGIGRD